MSQNDKAVLTAAVGYVFTGSVGLARPTPAELALLDPTIFGSQVQTVKVPVGSTGGTFTLTVNAVSTAAIPFNATPSQVLAALEATATVGVGNVSVTGVAANDAAGVDVSWIGAKQGLTLPVTGVGTTLTPSGSVTATVKTAVNGWKAVGHTSRGDMPEFGFDGGDSEVKGTWQNESLREVVTDPIADYLTMFLHQFDSDSFELYYGADASATVGVFGVANGNVAPVEKALLVLIVDGTEKVGFYSPKASVRRDDAVQLPVDEFASLPVKATFLKHANTNKFEWISSTLFS